jgi:2-oxoglutarate ferredoxin oxidoreductase subunit gamma
MPSTEIHEELLCAGFGGQGIMFLGKLLAQAAMIRGLNVTYLPSYGAEVRGGTAHCNVILSSDEIASPVVGMPTSVIVMNHPSLLKFEERVRPGGLLIVNTSLALSSASRQDIVILEIPATDMADSLGTVQVANMVALGCYLQQRPVVPLSVVIESLAEVLPKRRHDLLRLNQAALRDGAEFVARQEKAATARR